MAEVVAIKLELDAGQSVKEVQKLEDAIAEINNTSSNLTVDQKFEMLNSTLDTTTATFGEMSQAIESYKTIALNAGRESPVGQEALKRAAQLKDRITDLDREVDNLAKDGQALQGALQIGTGVMAGYQAFAGVTALLGDENEALMETMVKLQASMSVLQAIEQLRLATEKESLALRTLQNAKTKIAIGLQKAYSLAVGTSTKAMKGLKTALLAAGVGAIIVALGTIVAYWDDIKGAVSGLSKEQKKRNADLEKEKELTQANLENIDATENTLRLAGKSEQEILDMKLAQLDIQLDQQRQTIENAKLQKQTQIEASERNNKIAQNTIRILSLPITMLLGAIDMLTYGLAQVGILEEATNLEESFSGGIASMLFDPEEVASESDKTIEEAEKGLAELQNKRDGFTLKEQEKNKANYEKSKAIKQKQFEEELQMLRDKMKKELDLEQELQDLIIENMQDEDAKKLAQLQLQHDRELADLRDKYGMETELEIELLKKQARELNEAKKQIAQESKDEMDEMANFFEQQDDERRDNEVAKNIQATKTELTNLEETEKAKQQVRLAGVNATAGILNGLASLFDKNEKVQKANALAQIAIDTAMGFVNGLNIAQKSAKATGPAAAFAFPLFYATQVGAVLSAAGQAKKILGAGGGSGVTAPRISTPTNVTNTTTTSGTAPTGSGTTGFTSTNRVVLVESELQAMQERRRSTELISTI